MDRRLIFSDRPQERERGYMPAISLNPGRLLFTSGMTGRVLGGEVIAGGMGPQTQRTLERLEAILGLAGANFGDAIKQMIYVTDLSAYEGSGREIRAQAFGQDRPTSTALVIDRLAKPEMEIEIELVVDLPGDPAGKPLLQKFDVEKHGLDFFQGVIVNGGQLMYLAGQVANNPDGSIEGVGDYQQQGRKTYENIGHILAAAGGSSANVVKETTWVLDIDAWQAHNDPIRQAFYQGDFPASTLIEIPSLAKPEFLIEVEIIAALPSV